MKIAARFSFVILFAAWLQAQAPPPRGGGHGGFGPRFDMMSVGPGSKTPVLGAPYSGLQTSQMQQTLAGGNTISRQEQSKVYRDSQGRVRVEHTRSGPAASSGQPETIIAIFDPVAGYSYILNPAKMTAIKMPASQHNGPTNGAGSHPHGDFGRNGAQVQTESLGTQTVNGVSAAGTRRTETIPAGAIGNQQPIQVVRETWISTDLKVPVMIKSSDPRFGDMVMQLTNIAQAEPDASLFQVPAGYTITDRPAGPQAGGMRHGPGRN
jgi:hypothetical protein